MKNVKSIKKNVKKVQRMWGLISIFIFNFDMFFPNISLNVNKLYYWYLKWKKQI